MNYYKDKKTNSVYSYSDAELKQVDNLSSVESSLKEKEPEFILASNKIEHAENTVNELTEQLKLATESDDSEEIERLQIDLNAAKENYQAATTENGSMLTEYSQLKVEYDAFIPVIFEIRENIRVMKKMTEKEIDTHLNPPISKEQHIAEAEMQKQLCAENAEKNITILERKVRLNMATDYDKNSLTAWEIYSIQVADINTSLAPDINWPQKP